MKNQNDPAILYADDPTIRQGADGDWYHYPNRFALKVVFLLVSFAILGLGTWLIWDPAARFFTGTRAMVRVTEILREEPGGEQEVIRYRKDIPEGDHLTKFTYTVTYEPPEGGSRELTMAVGSIRNAYNIVNDEFEVIFFEDEDYAYGLFHHRTWAFGVGFLFVGGLLTIAAIPTLYMVGRPIKIDPEAAEPGEEDPEKGDFPEENGDTEEEPESDSKSES